MTLAVNFSRSVGRRKRKSNIDTRLIGLKQNDRSTDNAVQKRRFEFETLIHLFSKKCFCTILEVSNIRNVSTLLDKNLY